MQLELLKGDFSLDDSSQFQAARWRSLDLAHADIRILDSFIEAGQVLAIMDELIAKTSWRQEKIFAWGKEFLQPRLIAWHGDLGIIYKYSGLTLKPTPWTSLLLKLKKAIEYQTYTTFNSVLLNYYRNGRDSMGLHSDNEKELGDSPVIASLSLGAERLFSLRPIAHDQGKGLDLVLRSGSLLVMEGLTQKFWKHGIKKQLRCRDPRVNLTFRNIRSSRFSK